jgi:transcriptional regulator with XRE-family HTH domain
VIKRTPLQNKIFNWKQKLEKRGFSLTDLARKADVGPSYLYQLMKGQASNPDPEYLKKVEAVFLELVKVRT